MLTALAKIIQTLIISDIHIGSPVSRAKQVLALLRSQVKEAKKLPKEQRFLRIIINGDLWDNPNLGRLRPEEWELLWYLSRLSKKRWIQLILVKGNHDGSLATHLAPMIGIQVCDEYVWELAGRIFLVLHGDRFDYFISRHRVLSNIFSRAYLYVQELDPENQRFSGWIKQTSKRWLHVSKEVAEGAVKYSARYKADEVFCGHTHKAMQQRIGDVNYTNSGSWADGRSSHYVTITWDGTVELHEYVPRTPGPKANTKK